MRLDKYLKISRLIKRRTVANEACTGGRVTINGKVAKPSAEVNAGDILTLRMGQRELKVRINSIDEHASKLAAAELYTILGDSE